MLLSCCAWHRTDAVRQTRNDMRRHNLNRAVELHFHAVPGTALHHVPEAQHLAHALLINIGKHRLEGLEVGVDIRDDGHPLAHAFSVPPRPPVAPPSRQL